MLIGQSLLNTSVSWITIAAARSGVCSPLNRRRGADGWFRDPTPTVRRRFRVVCRRSLLGIEA
jgi:hypothetical protein